MYKKRLKIKPVIKLLRAGENVYDACAKSKISYRTFKRWQDATPRLSRIVELAKEVSESQRIQNVKASLYKRAVGYKYREVTIERSISNPKVKVRKIVIKQLAPDPTAAMFYLMNKAPDEWADKRALVNNYNVIKNTVNPLGALKDEELDGILNGILKRPAIVPGR